MLLLRIRAVHWIFRLWYIFFLICFYFLVSCWIAVQNNIFKGKLLLLCLTREFFWILFNYLSYIHRFHHEKSTENSTVKFTFTIWPLYLFQFLPQDTLFCYFWLGQLSHLSWLLPIKYFLKFKTPTSPKGGHVQLFFYQLILFKGHRCMVSFLLRLM